MGCSSSSLDSDRKSEGKSLEDIRQEMALGAHKNLNSVEGSGAIAATAHVQRDPSVPDSLHLPADCAFPGVRVSCDGVGCLCMLLLMALLPLMRISHSHFSICMNACFFTTMICLQGSSVVAAYFTPAVFHAVARTGDARLLGCDASGNRHDIVGALTAVESRAVSFQSGTAVQVPSLLRHAFGTALTVSVWFNRASADGYQGIVGTGYFDNGSFEIRSGNEFGGEMIGCSVRTEKRRGLTEWDFVNLRATPINVWHQAVLVYADGNL